MTDKPTVGSPCPICGMPIEEDGGCLRHEPEEVQDWLDAEWKAIICDVRNGFLRNQKTDQMLTTADAGKET